MDPEDVTVKNLDYTSQGRLLRFFDLGDTDENLKTATFTVSLSSAPSSDNVTITMKSFGYDRRGDLHESATVRPTTTPRAGLYRSTNWNSDQTVTVTGVADNLSDGDQSYAIRLSGGQHDVGLSAYASV